MSITQVQPSISRCNFGFARCDITPPVGIYHRFWGAASHDVAAGVHKPLTATVFIVSPTEAKDGDDGNSFVFVAIDHCLFRDDDMQDVLQAVSQQISVDRSRIQFCFSHTHSGGHICKSRDDMPGGEFIAPYLDELCTKVSASYQAALESMAPVTFTYGAGECAMGHNRDYWDDENQILVCGFNPDHPAGLPVDIIRIESATGEPTAVIVQYPCHPTTLAWENQLISPDYIGALRETVEQAAGVPCIFLPAPCGDTGPKVGFVGDTEIADSNGRQLGYAALSILESMPGGSTKFCYAGPVISGATLGAWKTEQVDEDRQHAATRFRHACWQVDLPYLPDIPSLDEAEQQLNDLVSQESNERASGDESAARDTRALVERKRRLMERIRRLPQGQQYPFVINCWQMGDAIWVALEGEPYHYLQDELQRRFADHPIIIMPLANGARSSYLPTREAYDKPLYQVEVALLAPGCLEKITESIAEQIQTWLAE